MKNLDLVDWTMQEARQLSPEHDMPSKPERMPTLSKLLEVLEGEGVAPNSNPTMFRIEGTSIMQPANDGLVARSAFEAIAEPKPNTVSSLPASTQAAPSIPADVVIDPKSALLNAILERDIHTAPFFRDRAIILRWALRDIKGNRSKLSPVNQRDLQDLVDMGLVEMRDGAPVLTNTGVSAIS